MRSASFCVVALGAMLAGCHYLPHSNPQPAVIVVQEDSAPVPQQQVPEDLRQVADLLGFAQRFSQMNTEEQKRELNSAQTAYNRDKSNFTRIRYAMLLGAQNNGGADDLRALALLDPYATPNQPTSLRQFANMLHQHLSEGVQAQRRAEQYKEQLEALRAIERSIIERGLEPQSRKP